MSYQSAPSANLTPAQSQAVAASAAARTSTLDTMSTIFANDMVTAFEAALASQSSNLPGITFALKDSTGADVTGTITLTPYVAPKPKH